MDSSAGHRSKGFRIYGLKVRKMKLSIIIPVYNGAHYLKTLFDCLNAQTCTDYEAVIVDDGSTDDTQEQYRILEKIYPRVHSVLYAKTNGGVSTARNLGIEKSSGDVLSFCDVDDELSPHYVEYILKGFSNHNIDLVFWKFQCCKPGFWKETTGTFNFISLEKGTVLRDYLYKRLVLGCWNCAIKRDIVQFYGHRYDENTKYSEDLNFVWKLLLSAKSVGKIDNVLYYYLIQPGSAMSHFDEQRLQGYKIAVDLTGFVYKMAPDFAPLYEKYEGSRMLWSIAWQAAQHMKRRYFFRFFDEIPLMDAMRTLRTYPRTVTMLSARLYCISPDLFRLSSKVYGCLLGLKNLGRE